MIRRTFRIEAFTLIELSVVLVIIGLLVGGVLVGVSLVGAASLRGTLSQIEKYQTATATFREKYGYLPGDIPDPAATQFGLAVRGDYAGQGDGNGVLEGVAFWAAGQNSGLLQATGEIPVFWVDLSTTKMTDGSFTAASQRFTPPADVTVTNMGSYLPEARLGQKNYIYVWSASGNNYFGLSAVTFILVAGQMTSYKGLSVQQAYNIDKKIDDGLPLRGNVLARYLTFGSISWAGTAGSSATPGSSTTCYDNGNVGGAEQQYSLAQNSCVQTNCALTFKLRQ